MLTRIIGESLRRRRRRKLLSMLAVGLGITVATVVGTMALDVGDKVSRELRSFGANISVRPAADAMPVTVAGSSFRPAGSDPFLAEADLAKLKRIFWRNNIVGFAPFLQVRASVEGHPVVLTGTWFHKRLDVSQRELFETGLRDLHPAWKVFGEWPEDQDLDTCLIGRGVADALSIKPGQTIILDSPGPRFTVFTLTLVPPSEKRVLVAEQAQTPRAGGAHVALRVRGILEAGGHDNALYAPLATVQKLAGVEGKVRSVEVSALTKPEDDFARLDPRKMTPDQFERWSCSPYVSSIAYQIQQAIAGSEARPILSVAEAEGRVLDRIGLLMALLAGAALVAAALAVASMMLATVLERRAEMGLFKSLGATSARVAMIFLLEASVIGLGGGVAGYAAGSLLARHLASAVFGSPAGIHWAMFPAALALALVVTWLGSAAPLARALRVPAATALRN